LLLFYILVNILLLLWMLLLIINLISWLFSKFSNIKIRNIYILLILYIQKCVRFLIFNSHLKITHSFPKILPQIFQFFINRCIFINRLINNRFKNNHQHFINILILIYALLKFYFLITIHMIYKHCYCIDQLLHFIKLPLVFLILHDILRSTNQHIF
jgi:hypothetical protein